MRRLLVMDVPDEAVALHEWLPVAIRHRPIRDAMTYRVNMTASGAHVCE